MSLSNYVYDCPSASNELPTCEMCLRYLTRPDLAGTLYIGDDSALADVVRTLCQGHEL